MPAPSRRPRTRLACLELDPRLTPAGLTADLADGFVGPPATPGYLRAGPGGDAAGVTAKFGDDVGFLYQSYLLAGSPGDKFVMSADQPNREILRVAGGRLNAEMMAAVTRGQTPAALAAALTALGAEVSATFGNVVSAYVPVGQLAALAADPALNFGYPSYTPRKNVGKTDDQGVVALRADVGGARYQVDGTGQTVGVMSDSFANKTTPTSYANDQASGDLPTVTVVSDLASGGSDEGRAMTQLVYDTAPGAKLAFATAYNTEAQFAANMVTLAKPVAQGGAGATVVTDDVGYFHEPFFQDGIVAQAADTINSTYGVPEFSSAGNSARDAYQSAFNSASATVNVISTSAQTYHNFSTTGTDVYFPLTLTAGYTVTMIFQWDQPYASASTGSPGTAGSANSVSLYLLNSSKSTILRSSTASVVGGDPYRSISYTPTSTTAGTGYVVLRLTNGAAPGLLKFTYDGATASTYATKTGTSQGHPMAAGAAGVAAAWAYLTPAYGTSPAQGESFTSAGGTPFLFDKAGNRLGTPDLRSQPRFTAPDGSDTTFFAQTDSYTNGYAFFGTSAAAPHAAAVAALVRQVNPALTPAQIYSVLQTTASDIVKLDDGTATGTGYDYDTGYGLIQADQALAAAANISAGGRVFRDFANDGTLNGPDVGQGGVAVFLDTNANGVLDSGTSAALASTDVPKAIPDGTGATPSRVTSTLAVSGLTGRVTKVVVTIGSLTHARVSDLMLTLVSPSGMRIPLWTKRTTGTLGANFTNTVLDDAASGWVESAAVPFTGTYRPYSPLSALIGENPNGTWALEARDTASGTTGSIVSWSLKLSYADPQTTTAADGSYTFAGLPTTGYYGGTFNVREVVPAGYSQTSPATLPALTLTSLQQATGVNLGNYAPLTTVASVAFDDGSGQRSEVRKVTVTLNGTVTAANIAAGAFTVTPTGGQSAAFSVAVDSVTNAGGQTVIVLKFSGTALQYGSLADGRYSLVIDGTKLIDSLGTGADAGGTVAPGTTGSRSFWRLYGDVNGDGTVNLDDLTAFSSAFGTSAGDTGYAAAFDYNADTTVNLDDLTEFTSRFGVSV